MKLSELGKLAYFGTPYEIEMLILEALRSKFVEVRIDHQSGTINFGGQSIESSEMRHQLTTLSKNLQAAVEMIHPERKLERKKKKFEKFAIIVQNLESEHAKVLARKTIIEKRKEILEHLEKERLAREEVENQRKKEERELERQRLAAEAAKKEAQRL
jgi:translation initiation factor 3 subunit A